MTDASIPADFAAAQRRRQLQIFAEQDRDAVQETVVDLMRWRDRDCARKQVMAMMDRDAQ